MGCARPPALLFRLFPALLALFAVPTAVGASGHHPVHFRTADGGTIDGTLFPAGKALAVVLAHGAVFDKESWYPQARRLQQSGVTALPFDFRGYGNSSAPDNGHLYQDVLGAVAYLEQQGYAHIALVGGSMGGAAVLDALARRDDPHITRVLLLAPAGGQPVAGSHIDKLFIVSAGDGLRSTVQSLYDRSDEPKQLEILPGSAHAQHIFAGPEAARLTDVLLHFLRP
ncbi:MAG: alpha/beta fold hydrolase [Gammaproteobacteria bacterium]